MPIKTAVPTMFGMTKHYLNISQDCHSNGARSRPSHTIWKKTVALKRFSSSAEPTKTAIWMTPFTIDSNSVCSVVKPKFLIRRVEKEPSPPVGIWILISSVRKSYKQRIHWRVNIHNL